MTLTKYLLVSSAIILISALQVWSVDNTNVNTCKDQACSTPFSFYHEGYPNLRSETDNLFEQRFKGDRIFTLSSDAKVQAWDGSVRTVEQHFDWMKAHIIEHASPDAPGFVKTGEKEGVLWETHEELTIKHRGVGYFRLKATVDVDPKTFACLMADPHLLFAMDATVRVMDFERSPTYPQNIKGKRKVWLAYFQQAPGGILPNLDGVDVSGFEVLDDGTVVQASIGLPGVLPKYPGDWYPKAFRSWDLHWGYTLTPVIGNPQRSELVLICQHDLKNWMVPMYLSNLMVGQTLADYVRTAEKVGQKLVASGDAVALRERHGL